MSWQWDQQIISAQGGYGTVAQPVSPTVPISVRLSPEVLAGLNPEAVARVEADPVKAAVFDARQGYWDYRPWGEEWVYGTPPTPAQELVTGNIMSADVVAGLNQETLNRILGTPDLREAFVVRNITRPDTAILTAEMLPADLRRPEVLENLNPEAVTRVLTDPKKAQQFGATVGARPAFQPRTLGDRWDDFAEGVGTSTKNLMETAGDATRNLGIGALSAFWPFILIGLAVLFVMFFAKGAGRGAMSGIV